MEGAWLGRGNVFFDLKHYDEALAAYDKALALKPDLENAWVGRGNVFYELKRYDEALAAYDKALALKPDLDEAWLGRGNVFYELKRYDEAFAAYDKTLARKPDFGKAWLGRGNVFYELKRYDEAFAAYDKALALKSDLEGAWLGRANIFSEQGHIHEAIACCNRAIALKPNFAEAFYVKSLCLLLLGDFEQGWLLFEWRKKRAKSNILKCYLRPLWLGNEDIAGKTLYIHPEFYLGDMIQICRYAKIVEEKRGAKVIISVQRPLQELLKTLSPTTVIIDENLEPGNFDYHCPLMSLPLAFKTTIESIPSNVPYLHADDAMVVKWKDKVGNKGVKIGICWQGNANVIGRSFPLAELYNISQIPNVRLISLQKFNGLEQLTKMPNVMNVEVFEDDFDANDYRSFFDLAALMMNLDLVITLDTSIAHLPGALARPTWVALKKVTDWRWGLIQRECPWYPTVKLFRQNNEGDWTSVFSEIHNELILFATKRL